MTPPMLLGRCLAEIFRDGWWYLADLAGSCPVVCEGDCHLAVKDRQGNKNPHKLDKHCAALSSKRFI